MFITKTELLVSLLFVTLSVSATPDVDVPGQPAELSVPGENPSLQEALKHYAPRSLPLKKERSASTCPAGWRPFQGNCYKLFSYQYSWNNAEFHCENIGSSLASAHNLEEYQVLQEMARGAGFTTAWIGGYFFYGWKWDDSTPFDYENWYSESSYRSYCLSLSSQGTQGWTSLECHLGHPFICSMRDC